MAAPRYHTHARSRGAVPAWRSTAWHGVCKARSRACGSSGAPPRGVREQHRRKCELRGKRGYPTVRLAKGDTPLLAWSLVHTPLLRGHVARRHLALPISFTAPGRRCIYSATKKASGSVTGPSNKRVCAGDFTARASEWRSLLCCALSPTPASRRGRVVPGLAPRLYAHTIFCFFFFFLPSYFYFYFLSYIFLFFSLLLACGVASSRRNPLEEVQALRTTTRRGRHRDRGNTATT